LLFINEFKDLQKTALNILNNLTRSLNEFDISITNKNLIFVTDRGPNIVASLKKTNRLNCMAHIINNILGTIEKKDEVNHIKEFLEKCRILVTFFKKTYSFNNVFRRKRILKWKGVKPVAYLRQTNT
jgi:hypothetical protein